MVLMHVGITDQLSDVSMGYEGLTVTIERPDGQTDTIRDIKTDSTGGTGVVYTPSMTGTHIVQAHFPEQTLAIQPLFFPAPIDMTFLASDSDVVELEVQQDSIEYYPDAPLPSQYWTRPIDSQLRSWTDISGSWGTVPYGLYAPYNDGPETAHILWAKPLTSGGLVGGEVGPLGWGSFEIGDAYEGKYTIVATFTGSEGYYASTAQTAAAVGPAEDVPSAEEIADATASRLPACPTASEVAQETVNKLPAYLTIDLVILIIAAVGVVIGLIVYMALRKQK